MPVLVKKWGNSAAVRIPASVMEAARFVLDQPVRIRAEQGRVIIEPVAHQYKLDSLLAGINADNLHDEADFGAPVGREIG
jgi:antitoxin MazE